MLQSISELLVYGLVLAGFLLLNYVVQQRARRAQNQQEGADSAAPTAIPMDEPLGYAWGRAPSSLPVANEQAQARADVPTAPPAQKATSAPLPPYTAPRALFGSKQEMRHAIVLMTVLGPCRALEPFDRQR
jgi:hypothetical protein